jgi:hypothetical protein
MDERWKAPADKRVYVVRLVAGLIPGCNLCERYAFAKHKNSNSVID